MTKIVKTSKIAIEVQMEEDKIPAKIHWQASDSPVDGAQDCSAFLFSVWDGDAKDQLSIQLWTKEMTVEEMNHFYFRTFMLMAQNFQNATGNQEEVKAIKEFAQAFGKRTEVIK